MAIIAMRVPPNRTNTSYGKIHGVFCWGLRSLLVEQRFDFLSISTQGRQKNVFQPCHWL